MPERIPRSFVPGGFLQVRSAAVELMAAFFLRTHPLFSANSYLLEVRLYLWNSGLGQNVQLPCWSSYNVQKHTYRLPWADEMYPRRTYVSLGKGKHSVGSCLRRQCPSHVGLISGTAKMARHTPLATKNSRSRRSNRKLQATQGYDQGEVDKQRLSTDTVRTLRGSHRNPKAESSERKWSTSRKGPHEDPEGGSRGTVFPPHFNWHLQDSTDHSICFTVIQGITIKCTGLIHPMMAGGLTWYLPQNSLRHLHHDGLINPKTDNDRF